MADWIEEFVSLVKKSMDGRLWLNYFLLLLLMWLGIVVSIILVAVPFYFAAITYALSLTGFFWYAILSIIFLLLVTVWGVLVSGTQLNLSKGFLENGSLDLGQAFDQAKRRVWAAFKQQIILLFAMLILLGVLALPFLFSLVSLISNGASQNIPLAIFSLIGSAFLGILAFGLVLLALVPVLLLFSTVVFFEPVSAWNSIVRSFQLGRKNYFSNFAFFILFLVFYAIVQLPMAVLGQSQSFLAPANPLFWMVLLLNGFFSIVLGTWLFAVSGLFLVKVYQISTVEEHQEAMKQLVQQTIEKHDFIVERHEKAMKEKKQF